MDLTNRVLGETAGIVGLQDQTAIQTACAMMAAQATRELCILSPDLDAPLYDKAGFLEPVRRLALQSPRTPVRILLFDAEPAVREGHRLVELARQLTSRIQIRCVPAEFGHYAEAYMIADDNGYVLRPMAEVWEGRTDFAAPMRVRHIRGQFEHIWERSSQSLELITFGRGL